MNAQGAAQVAADVTRLRPANFKSEVVRLSRAVRVYLDHYQKFVHGKTGNEEAERRLRHVWVSINRDLTAAIQKWPSVTEQVLDKVVQFVEDFSASVKRVLEEYAQWVVNAARDTLRRYREAMVRLIRLKRAGRPDPEGIIPKAENLVERIRTLFRTATGKDLDEIVQREFGAYPSLGQQVPPDVIYTRPIVAAHPAAAPVGWWARLFGGAWWIFTVISVLAIVVWALAELFSGVKESSGDIAGVVIIALAGAGMVLFILQSILRR
jgi:plasmid stabilization system protein ParE